MLDISGYDEAALRALARQIDDELKQRKNSEIAKARTEILAIAERVGLPISELLPKNPRVILKGSPAAVRFRHPDDPSKEWSGRGRQPKWVREWVGNAKSLDSLRVGTQ